MGHEYCGLVEEVGSAVRSVKPGQFVIGSFFASDNTCPHCRAGYQTSCQHREFVGGAQAPLLRVPLADGTLVPTISNWTVSQNFRMTTSGAKRTLRSFQRRIFRLLELLRTCS
jgi:threonine dehydrogenase-like Zn-dependent dehydrogenase